MVTNGSKVMRYRVAAAGGVVALWLVSCGGSVTDSDGTGGGGGAGAGGGASSEQITERLPELCADACAVMEGCEQGACDCSGDACDCRSPNRAECAADCEQDVGPMVGASDVCAAAFSDFAECISREGCAAVPSSVCSSNGECVEQPGACAVEMEHMKQSCDSGRGSTQDVGTVSPPPTAAVGPAVVTCSGASVGGATAPAPPPDADGGVSFTPQVLCIEEREGCTDGQSYSVICLSEPSGGAECTCARSGALESSHLVPTPICGSAAMINDLCGWSVAW